MTIRLNNGNRAGLISSMESEAKGKFGKINLCNACVSLVSVCLASMISQKGNYTTIMLGELISNCTHTSYTSIIVGELIVQSFPLPWYCRSQKGMFESLGTVKHSNCPLATMR